ncbi:hypothetical protein Hamer_G022283 [Homarus americanus]|uniref:Uncharacterized protein n=1 Tax=Homarus americanus TaxID=6706 RepID=A0A8J5MJY6_HOMAM|nr:hypothetical protein Hamer_G022283 [Homarus americanus]
MLGMGDSRLNTQDGTIGMKHLAWDTGLDTQDGTLYTIPRMGHLRLKTPDGRLGTGHRGYKKWVIWDRILYATGTGTH